MPKLLAGKVVRRILLWTGSALGLVVVVLAGSNIQFLISWGSDAKHPNVATDYQLRTLDQTTSRLYSAGDYHAAASSAEKQRAELERKFGSQHADTLRAQAALGIIYQRLGRYAESEQLFLQAREIAFKTLGAEHEDTLALDNALAVLYAETGRNEKAEELVRRVLGIRERKLSNDHPDTLTVVNNLAAILYGLGRHRDAEALLQRALEARMRTLGPDDPATLETEHNVAEAYRGQGRLAEAESLYRRVIEGLERTLGPNHPDTLLPIRKLGEIYRDQARYEDAERLLLRVHTTQRRIFGEAHKNTIVSASLLASVYLELDKYDEAEDLLIPALAEARKVHGNKDPITLKLAHYLGVLRGKKLPKVLDLLDLAQGKVLAEDLLRTVITDRADVLGEGHPDTLVSLSALGTAYLNQGHFTQAGDLFEAGLKVSEITGAGDKLTLAHLNNLAYVRYLQKNWGTAVDLWRRAISAAVARNQHDALRIGETGDGSAKHLRQPGISFLGMARAALRMIEAGTADQQLAVEAFQIAQGALHSDAGRSLAMMATRQATRDDELSRLVREQQDLAAAWKNLEARRVAELGKVGKRDPEAESVMSARMANISGRLALIDGTLAKMFPAYTALLNPAPLSIVEVQDLLKQDEALVLFLDAPEWHGAAEETLIWAVTKTNVVWARSILGTAGLTRAVQTLRCGLDEEEWATTTQARRCADLLGLNEKPNESQPLPFHLLVAHTLYKELFGHIENIIAGKRLLIVPSGPLTSLPFHVLVTKPPKAALPTRFEAFRNVAWLARTHALTTLPAVTSLKVLRQASANRQVQAADYAGFGDPVLNGERGSCRMTEVPRRCPPLEVAQLQKKPGAAEGGMTASKERARATTRGRGRRSGKADVDHVFAHGADVDTVLEQVRALCPLPDTAYEIKCVAGRFGEKMRMIHLGGDANESEVKALSESGKLGGYRILHFATHGLLAGDVERMSQRQGEPALVLTPPNQPAGLDDDGLLTASEVAALKLNADWVVLSACNTAVGDRVGADALSGLARAFFYAGARALLVSHWPVYSDAAVQLTTRAFAELEQNPESGRAQALQRAMSALMDDSAQLDNGHPAVWAPFVVVGD